MAVKWAPALVLCVAACSGATDDRYRGTFAWGHEVRAFRPCGSQKVYWITGEPQVLQPLSDRSEELRQQRGGKPYQPLYIEAVGAVDTRSKRDGFAKEYDGLIRLREVRRMSEAVPEECRR